MSIVGIDPSLTGTGIATETGLTTITSKPLGTTIHSRHLRLAHTKQAILETLPTPLRLVVVEAPAFSRTTGHHHDRSGLWWLLINSLMRLDLDVIEVTPTALKKFGTGRGTATKADMRMALFKRAGLDCRDDNQVDAWWLRQIGCHLTHDPDQIDLPADQVTVLNKIRTSCTSL